MDPGLQSIIHSSARKLMLIHKVVIVRIAECINLFLFSKIQHEKNWLLNKTKKTDFVIPNYICFKQRNNNSKKAKQWNYFHLFLFLLQNSSKSNLKNPFTVHNPTDSTGIKKSTQRLYRYTDAQNI